MADRQTIEEAIALVLRKQATSEVRRLKRQGWTQREIADRFGIAVANVRTLTNL